MYQELITELTNTQVFWESIRMIRENFSINSAILWVMMIFLVVGGVDKLRGNKLGYGVQFDEAFATMKPMALAMIGVLVMVPIFRMVLEPIIAPIYEFFGASPAMFAGTLLGVDAGAYPLAMEMAGGDVASGSFSGVVLGGTFGIILLGMIPISLELLREEDREVFSAAVLLAIITIPLGCIAGGLVMSLTAYPMAFGVMMANLVPVILVAALIALGLYFRPKQMMNAFCVLGKAMQMLLIVALVLATVQAVTGLRLPLFYLMVEPAVPGGISPLNDALIIVGNIALILAGALPM
ncbi:MAG: ethanolamine utilization protein EutH, partial [Firmicutes bacterium]|nr:ethanolamine utilization protein EutH [Bacillota bacterium]